MRFINLSYLVLILKQPFDKCTNILDGRLRKGNREQQKENGTGCSCPNDQYKACRFGSLTSLCSFSTPASSKLTPLHVAKNLTI
ncbi:rCG61796 [Rattus norvegicus]|uniref:RCG61796 n=1 Tax=Rattus norvegicus TaxID=10116 RepID=A6HAI5_RAT|nr:rCG61796 [Rattus norvegicus]